MEDMEISRVFLKFVLFDSGVLIVSITILALKFRIFQAGVKKSPCREEHYFTTNSK